MSASIKSKEAISSCDELYEASKYQEAYDAIMRVKDDPDPEIQWRIVRMTFKVAEQSGNKTVLVEAINNGLEALKANMEKAPKCSNTHKWYAILLASKPEHANLKQEIEEAFVIREHLEKAIELNPSDGYAYYVLGRWCFQVASVGWLKRKAAAALFAKPPESTYEEALEHFKKADELKPDMFNTCYLLAAKCLLEINGSDKLLLEKFLKKCVAKEQKDAESKTNGTEARKLAQKYKINI